jgi:alcohol dehydrogenase
MRALSAAPGGRLRWRQVPAPARPGPDGATVRPIAVATCDIDCPLTMGTTQLLLPLRLGHECVAEVIDVGERVQAFRPGDRVIVPFQISCGACGACAGQRTGNCTRVPPLSMYGMGLLAGHWGGAFADELAVPYADAMLVALPDGVDVVAAASLADNVCDAYRHLGPHLPGVLERDPDAQVLIVGTTKEDLAFGYSVALYAGLIARALGARNVLLADAREIVRAHADRLGLDTAHPRELREHPPAPLVVDVSFDGPALALSCTAPDGVCSSSGGLAHRAQIPLLSMYVRNVTLHLGRAHVRAVLPQALALMSGGRLEVGGVITTVAPMDEAPGVLREHFLRRGAKAVFTAP